MVLRVLQQRCQPSPASKTPTTHCVNALLSFLPTCRVTSEQLVLIAWRPTDRPGATPASTKQ